MLKQHEGTAEQMIIAFHGLMTFLIKHEAYYPMLSEAEKADFRARIERTIGEYDAAAPQITILKSVLAAGAGRI